MSTAASSRNAGVDALRVVGLVSKSRDLAGEMTASMALVSLKRVATIYRLAIRLSS